MREFIVYPAIDLRQGRVVRLQYGDPNLQTVFGDDPAAAGRRWVEAGARWLHVVNLDGAFGEKSAANWEAVTALVKLPVKIQFGGGIRTLEDVEKALHAGVERVILGTAAVENPALVSAALAACGPAHLAVGIDARDGEVKTHGWQSGGGLSPLALAQSMADLGVETLIHTDISRDGVLTGVNGEKSAEIARATGLAVIASGGVASLSDIEQTAALGLSGVIAGRALYDGKFQLQEALTAAARFSTY